MGRGGGHRIPQRIHPKHDALIFLWRMCWGEASLEKPPSKAPSGPGGPVSLTPNALLH